MATDPQNALPEPGIPAKNASITEVNGLLGLARWVHDRGASPADVWISANGDNFLLSPSRQLCLSSAPRAAIGEFKDSSLVVKEGFPLESSPGPHQSRLQDFFWEVGFLAGAGTLFPWLDEGRSYKIKRWPPAVSSSRFVKVSALLGRRSYVARDLADSAGFAIGEVNDYLNACSLSSCLTGEAEVREPEPAPVASAPEPITATEKKETLSLLQRIRARLGWH